MRITIVGSSIFAKQMFEYRILLMKKGYKVNLHEHYIKQGQGKMKRLVYRMKKEHALVKRKYNYIKYHYKEIVDSDAILVLNFDKNEIKNYIGGNTLMEIGFAFVHNKKIFLLNSIPKINYSEEIKSMNPIIINGNVDLIK